VTMGDLNAETIYGSFEETAQRFPGRVAMIYLDERIRYQSLKDMVLRLSASLLRLGIREGTGWCSTFSTCLRPSSPGWPRSTGRDRGACRPGLLFAGSALSRQ